MIVFARSMWLRSPHSSFSSPRESIKSRFIGHVSSCQTRPAYPVRHANILQRTTGSSFVAALNAAGWKTFATRAGRQAGRRRERSEGRDAQKLGGKEAQRLEKKREKMDFMDIVADAVKKAAPALIEGLASEKGYAVVDNFLSPEWMHTLRGEAVSLFKGGSFAVSQSTRFDPETEQLVTYDKHNVYAMQLNGGEDYYKAPCLHEYVVSTVKTVIPLLSEAFPEAHLDPSLQTNKLAVCTGDGSSYDKHYDNAGSEDTRKVTILIYMNEWRPEMGGQFRIFGESADDNQTDIEPRMGRLFAFWSDVLVHSVLPSEAPNGEQDHRYALTLWLTTVSPDYIARDNSAVKHHFG